MEDLMTFVAISDSHGILGYDRLVKILDQCPSLPVLCLGDLSNGEWNALREVSASHQLFTVCGNHDLKRVEPPGHFLHATKAELNGLTLTGMSGSVKYKDSDAHWLLEDWESETLVDLMPHADILLTHDSMKLLFDGNGPAHVGLSGVSRYVERQKPLVNVFGHHHRNVELRHGDTLLLCVYGVRLVSLHSVNGRCEVVQNISLFDPDKDCLV